MKRFILWTVSALVIIGGLATLYVAMDFPPGTKQWALGKLQPLQAWFKPKPASKPAPKVAVVPPAPKPAVVPPPPAEKVAAAPPPPPPAAPKPEVKPPAKPVTKAPEKAPKRATKAAEKRPVVKKPAAKKAPSPKPAPSIRPAATEEHAWQRWNIAPYATSFEEACRKASAAIDGFDKMPAPVREHFKKAVGEGCEGGKEAWLTPNMRLEQMWSGGRNPHVMNNEVVGNLPVLRSPDGRPYRPGTVAQTARTAQWSYEFEGKIYYLELPFVCFNWAWRVEAAPPAKVIEKCVEYSFSAPVGGQVIWSIVTTTGPLPPDACNAQKQGDGAWVAWNGECVVCVTPAGTWAYIRSEMGAEAKMPHKFVYGVTHTRQTLRFSTAIWNAMVQVCLVDPAGKQSCGVYMFPKHWKQRYRVEISDALWVWDLNNCR